MDKNLEYVQWNFGSVFVAMLELSAVILMDGRFDHQRCYLYMFKFYKYYSIYGLEPSRGEMSIFIEKVHLFLKFHKYYTSENKKDILTIQGCYDRKRWKEWII